jgi:hypothetical protein
MNEICQAETTKIFTNIRPSTQRPLYKHHLQRQKHSFKNSKHQEANKKRFFCGQKAVMGLS